MQMHVVLHQAPGRQFKAQLPPVPLHRGEKPLVVLVILKQYLPADSPAG